MYLTDFLDKIELVYEDQSQVQIGLNSGVEAPDQLVLAPGESLVKIKHEAIRHKTLLGCSIAFTTSFGREYKYGKPDRNRKPDPADVHTFEAAPGQSIAGFNIVRGHLTGLEFSESAGPQP